MRYIAEYQVGATVLPPGQMHEIYSPATPSVVSGRIRNLSATKDLIVSFYVEPRGSQGVRLPPLHSLDLNNRPAGRVIIQAVEGEPFGVFDYLLTLSQVEAGSDLTEILSTGFVRQSRLRLEDLIEYIGRRTLRFVGPVQSSITMARPNDTEVGLVDVTPALASGNDPIIVQGTVGDGVDGYNQGMSIYDPAEYKYASWGWPLIAEGAKWYPVEGVQSTYYYVGPFFNASETTYDVTIAYYMAPLDLSWPDTWVLPTNVSHRS